MERISSRQNALVKRFRAAARAGRTDGDALLDGPHLIGEALASGIALDVAAFVDPPPTDELRQLARRAAAAGVRTVVAAPAVLAAMSPVRTPTGAVALARLHAAPLPEILRRSPALVVVLHEVQDPGNVGAAIRAAEAFGASGAVCTAGAADPFGWKAIRGSMGSTLRLPVAAKVPGETLPAALREAGFRIVAAVPRAGVPLTSCDFHHASAIVVGSEGSGLPEDVLRSADSRVTIPTSARVESLNVGTAVAVMLYEAARQRVGH